MVGTDTDVTEDSDIADTDPGIIVGDYMARFHRRRYSHGRPRRSWDDAHSLEPDSDYYFPYGWVGAGYYAMQSVDKWRIRGDYYRDYYKNTGKKPKYYSKLTRRRYKW